MPEYRSTRILSAVAFISLAGVFAQSTYGARAAEECLSKPNSPAPQGEHWYYRMDHANGRQCWRLGPVGLRIQKTAPASEKRSAPAAATQSETSARAQRPATTGHASAEVAPETNVAAAAAPVYWLDASRLLNQPSTVPPAAQQSSLEERSASSPDPSPSADESPAPARSVVASAGDSLPQTVARAEEPQRIVPIAKPATSIVDDDHTFALLLLMFVTLAIAGPMLHYSERRRRRRRLARPVQAPRWAPTDTPNAPVADVEMPFAPAPAIDQSPEPPASTSPFETERLEKALQQLLDRLQKEHPSMQSAVPSARRTEIEMKKSA